MTLALAAVLTLALGIGATTAIYSVVDTILLQPLPFDDSDRLVRVVENVPSPVAGRPPMQRGVSYQDFLEWRTRTSTLSGRFAVASLGPRTVRTSEGTARLWGGMISGNAFTLLGARAMLGRTASRQREMAVRVAIGAGRGRLVRQVLTECAVLAVAGGALGAVLAAVGVTLVKEMASVEAPGIFRIVFDASILPRGNEVGIDLKMFGIAFSIAAMTSLVFGVVPALQLSRTNSLHVMGARGGGSGRGESRIRAALVVGQLVMATVLLVGAGLLIHSFVQLSTVEKGYDPSNVLAFQLVLPADYSISRKTGTIEAVLAGLRATPNVESAGFTRAGILIPEEIFLGTFVPHGQTLEEMRTDPMKPRLRPVSHGYLTAMGVPVLDGREFQAADAATSAPVIVISRSVARRYFGAGRAVGQFTPLDPTTFMAVSLMFGLVATFASLLPALRATKVDPIVTLRTE